MPSRSYLDTDCVAPPTVKDIDPVREPGRFFDGERSQHAVRHRRRNRVVDQDRADFVEQMMREMTE